MSEESPFLFRLLAQNKRNAERNGGTKKRPELEIWNMGTEIPQIPATAVMEAKIDRSPL